jgi:hypothetical protein
MRIPELGNEDLEDETDWSDALSEALTEYCEEMEKQEGMILTLTEADKLEMTYEEG